MKTIRIQLGGDCRGAPSLLPSWIHRDLLRHQKGFWWRWHPWATPNPHPHQLLPASSPLFQRTCCGGGGAGGGISLGKVHFKSEAGGGEGVTREKEGIWGKIRAKKSLLFYNAPKQERRKSRLLPANPEGGDASAMRHSLASISRGFGRRRRRRSINSSRWDGASRGTAAGTRAEDAGSSPGRIVLEQPLPISPREVGVGGGGGGGLLGRPELGPPLSQVPAWPCHSPCQKRRKGPETRTPGWRRPRGQPPPLCARSREAEGAAAAGAGPSPCARPGGRSWTRPSGLPPRPLLLRRPRLPLLKEDSAQPNSSLIIPAQISLRRKHSLSSRTPPLHSR